MKHGCLFCLESSSLFGLCCHWNNHITQTKKMLLFQLLLMLAASADVDAIHDAQRQRRLGRKEDTSRPTSLPTIVPTETPTMSPMIQHHEPMPEHQRPLEEICEKKNAEKLDICIEYFASGVPSVTPSNMPSTWPTVDATSSDPPTSKPTRDVHIEDQNNRVMIQLGYFDMSITIISETKKQLRLHDTFASYRQGGDLTRQYEQVATTQHLHKVYTEHFLNPLTGLNLTFIDVGETNVSATSTRSSIFYGSVEFERIDGYPDPSKIEVDELTNGAFVGEQKKKFLDEFQIYHGTNSEEKFAYDAVVQTMDHSHGVASVVDETHDNEETSLMLPVVGALSGALVICIAGVSYLIYKKESEKKNRRTHPKSPSPMHQILHKKRALGEFDSDDEEIIDFHAHTLNDAYMDSASIRSRSPGDSFFQPQFKFHDENVDNLHNLGVDVEQIAIPALVEKSSASGCLDDEFVDAVSEMR